jgi:hypothetical protein
MTVITAMHRGEALHKHFTPQGLIYRLNLGVRQVSNAVVALVVADVRVVPVNDGLFPSTPQTWRFVEQ